MSTYSIQVDSADRLREMRGVLNPKNCLDVLNGRPLTRMSGLLLQVSIPTYRWRTITRPGAGPTFSTHAASAFTPLTPVSPGVVLGGWSLQNQNLLTHRRCRYGLSETYPPGMCPCRTTSQSCRPGPAGSPRPGRSRPPPDGRFRHTLGDLTWYILFKNT